MRRAALLVLVVLAVLVSDALASGAPPRFAGCASYLSPTVAGSVRPASIVIACGDGNFYVDHLRWSSWGPTVANATGLGHANDCTPYCAAGKFHTYRLSVRLDLRRVCGTTRRIAQFTRISWRFTGVRPRGVGPSDSQSFRCSKP